MAHRMLKAIPDITEQGASILLERETTDGNILLLYYYFVL